MQATPLTVTIINAYVQVQFANELRKLNIEFQFRLTKHNCVFTFADRESYERAWPLKARAVELVFLEKHSK